MQQTIHDYLEGKKGGSASDKGGEGLVVVEAGMEGGGCL